MRSPAGRFDAARDADRTLLAVVGVTALALLARLVVLGDRIAHWDEARVGFDVLRYAATGAWEYRPIVHGPFLPHVNEVVFDLLGPDDFTMRLVVALVGGLLPLAAWLFREHLRDREVLALAVLLTIEPSLLYYSRFMRNDVLVAAFVFAALGCYLRLYDTGRRRYLFAGTFLLALAFTTKENAILYVVAIGGALVLLLDHRLFLAREPDDRWTAALGDLLGRVGRGLWSLRFALLVAAVEFLVVVVFFYAPRGAAGPNGVGLWGALANPSMLPPVIEAGSVGAAQDLVDRWFLGVEREEDYFYFLGHYVRVLWFAAAGLVVLATIGFVADRYRGERPRDLVALGFYWGVASIVGYPFAVDIRAPWAVVHAAVPLAIPAAAGLAMFYGWGRDAFDRDDRIDAALAGLVLLLLVGQLAGTAVQTSYLEPQGEDNVLVQYAQPAGDMRPALEAVHRAARDEGRDAGATDVFFYSDTSHDQHFYVANESDADRLPVSGGGWYHRLPLPWYYERYGATVDSSDDPDAAIEQIQSEEVPVVIVRERDRSAVEESLEGYRSYTYKFRQSGPRVVFFVEEQYAATGPD